MDSDTVEQAGTPVVRVLSGHPTPEETAAVAVLVAALASGSGGDTATPRRRPRWSDPRRIVSSALPSAGWGRR